MKKTLAAAAILAAFAGSAFADVTVYGGMDTSLVYTHESSAGDSVAMESGNNATTMVGFKGSEKISDGLTAGFKLEAQFNSDTGKASNTLFEREALLYVKGTYGELGLGRTGALDASTGSYAFLGSGNTGFGGGYGGVGDNGLIFLGKNSRLDNAIVYKSPVMAGVTLLAQVASGANADGDDEAAGEYTHDQQRYYAVGARYSAGAFNAGLVASIVDYDNAVMNAKSDANDATTVSGFANYDFGVAKVLMGAQWFKGVDPVKAVKYAAAGSISNGVVKNETKLVEGVQGVEGYGLTLAVAAPVCGGTAKAIVGYGEAETTYTGMTKGYDQKNLMVGAIYDYKLSKQTGIYAAAGYHMNDADFRKVGTDKQTVSEKTDKTETTKAMVGIYHTF